ncbi:hypothetical protein [Bacillus halotolerans]|uniref:hypothetical protein n=1 Tax=Bacillus halotolerans TaxID=260554 RepID=UPI001BCB8849|nr:hypothetical protein [Bacillus halotolerans]MCM3354701.1 hypothetical protein [Bacillus halotolerans]QVN27015.1 hypothetical protein JYG31_17920 [Bacillus halotolerans]
MKPSDQAITPRGQIAYFSAQGRSSEARAVAAAGEGAGKLQNADASLSQNVF